MRRYVSLSVIALVVAFTLFTATLCEAASTTKRGIPECDSGVMQSSGYIDIPGIGNTKKHMFYWLFAPRHWPTDGSEPPVMMWMTGGPGCSSEIALAIELGPCMIDGTTGQMSYNAYGWNDNAYLLFVDQPVGVGYSYSEDESNWVHNESEVADDIYSFLQAFAKKFATPSITGKNDFYVIGESYAGHYVPSVGYRILQGNLNGDGPHINLKAVSIGNGIVSPIIQFPSFATLAYNYCKDALGYPCISDAAHEQMLSELPHCLELLRECNSYPDDQDFSCVEANEVCYAIKDYYTDTGRNSYDIRVPCEGDMCYPMEALLEYFDRADVRTTLGVSEKAKWSTCNGDVGALFSHDRPRNMDWKVPPMLAAGIRVHVYAGDMDFTCNWIGNYNWTHALEWPGKAAFNAAPYVEFSVNGKPAGMERTYGNFTFLRIYDAGHMVPMDQPEVSLKMVHKYLSGESMLT